MTACPARAYFIRKIIKLSKNDKKLLTNDIDRGIFSLTINVKSLMRNENIDITQEVSK